MNKIIYTAKISAMAFFILHFFSINTFSQNAIPSTVPAGTTVNYIRTWTAAAPDQSAAHLISRQIPDVLQSTQYYDALGRPIQTVAMQASPAGNDMVTVNYYDPGVGTETFKYLPFASNTTANANDLTNDGNFKIDPFQQQVGFYNNYLNGQSGETSTSTTTPNWAYSKTNYEPSPSSRILNTYAPGVNWVGTESTLKHNIQNQYYLNTVIDNVRKWDIPIWDINNPQSNIIPTCSGAYDPNQLLKSITIDENNHQVIEFKDMYDQVILTKTQVSQSAFDGGGGSAHSGWLCTYYVYDDYGNLRFVITPKEVQSIDGTWIISPEQADELCFRYEYDNLNRLVVKKIPGTGINIPSGNTGEVWMVYDQRNRVVMQQDGNLRATQKWKYTVYDNLDRATTTGVMNDANSLMYHLNNASGSLYYPNPSAPEILTQTFYDDYSSWMNSANSSTLTSSMDGSINGSGNTNFLTPSTSYPYAQSVAVQSQTNMLRGLTMGSKTELLDKSGYLYTVNFYDSKGRSLQSQSINITGGKDILTTQFDWSGHVLGTLLSSTNNTLGAIQTHNMYSAYVYDNLGRIKTISKNISSTLSTGAVNSGTKIIVSNQYDEVGKLNSKQLAPYFTTYKSTGIENLKYDYNVHGKQLGANRDFAKTPLSTTNYFGYDLGYDQLTIKPSGTSSSPIGAYALQDFKGNISGQVWKSIGDGVARKYDYSYDYTSQLNSAAYHESPTVNSWVNSPIDYSVPNIQYDANSNITQMQQNGFMLGGSQQIDMLQYHYTNGEASNKLQYILDNSSYNTTNSNSTLGDFHYTGNKSSATVDYNYDANGNILVDNNRTTNLSYNILNLPQVVSFSSKGSSAITYLYDALGNKIRKTITDNTVSGKTITTVYTYIAGFVYKRVSTSPSNPATDYQDILQFTGDEEGRIRYVKNTNNFAFDYYIKDHLGNVRMVLTDESQPDPFPVATLEGTGASTDPIAIEQSYYSINNNPSQVILASSVSGYPSNYENKNGGTGPNDPVQNTNPNCSNTSVIKQTDQSKMIYLLNGQTTATRYGLGVAFKVMAGDKIDIFGKSFYSSVNAGGNSSNISLVAADIINGMFLAPMSPIATKGSPNVLISNNAFQQTLNTNVINPRTTGGTSTVPRAFINYIFFDDQLNYVTSDASPVSTSANTLKDHSSDAKMQSIPALKNGYVYVFCSNESPVNVYFDNLQVVLTHGPIVEETHYYPFGLTMNGISSHAVNKMLNFSKYNGMELQNQEFSDGSGIEMYDYKYRLYDQQIGRFTGQDRLADKYVYYSPYQFAGNKVPNDIDLDGLEPENPVNALWESAGISSDGSGNTQFNPHSDLGQYYSGTKWLTDGVKSMIILGTLFDAGLGLMEEMGLSASEMELAESLGGGSGAMSAADIGFSEARISSALQAGASMEQINAVGWEAAEEGARQAQLQYAKQLGQLNAYNDAMAAQTQAIAAQSEKIMAQVSQNAMENVAAVQDAYTKSITHFYPPNNGFVYKSPGIAEVDQILTRYGANGSYFSPPGVSIDARALPYGTNTDILFQYRVLHEFPIEQGPAASWFGKTGGGWQIYSEYNVNKLLEWKWIEAY